MFLAMHSTSRSLRNGVAIILTVRSTNCVVWLKTVDLNVTSATSASCATTTVLPTASNNDMNKCLTVVLLSVILYASADVPNGRIDRVIVGRRQTRPRASMPYSLNPALSYTGLIPFVNEEDFRSPLYYCQLCGTDYPLWSRSMGVILR